MGPSTPTPQPAPSRPPTGRCVGTTSPAICSPASTVRAGGTRVEFHPLDQSQVDRPRRRAVEYRTLDVRHWDRIVQAWADEDEQALDDAWVNDVAVDLGSQWGQYEYVTNIGFGA